MQITRRPVETHEVLLFNARRTVEFPAQDKGANVSKGEIREIKGWLTEMSSSKPTYEELHEFNSTWLELAKRLYQHTSRSSKNEIRAINEQVEKISQQYEIGTLVHYISRDENSQIKIEDHLGNKIYPAPETVETFKEISDSRSALSKKVEINGNSYEVINDIACELHEGDLFGRNLAFTSSSVDNPDYKWGIKITLGSEVMGFIDRFNDYAKGSKGVDRLIMAKDFVMKQVKNLPSDDPSYYRIKTLEEIVRDGDVCVGKSVLLMTLINHDSELREQFPEPKINSGILKIHPSEIGVIMHTWISVEVTPQLNLILDASSDSIGFMTNQGHGYLVQSGTLIAYSAMRSTALIRASE